MMRFIVSKVIKVMVLGAIALAVFGWVVMALWNWLIPGLTGWHTLGYAQAFGLLLLCRLLFGGIGRGRHLVGGMGHDFGAHFSRMSPEEREGLRERFRQHARERFAGRWRAAGGGEADGPAPGDGE